MNILEFLFIFVVSLGMAVYLYTSDLDEHPEDYMPKD